MQNANGRRSAAINDAQTKLTPDAAPPRVWLLVDDRPGHRTQVVGAARGLGLASEEKRLSFNALERLPNPLLGATLATLDAGSRRLLAPPFPELVIGMGRRVAPVARWIAQASGGRTKIVLIGRKIPGDFADLTVRCAHFGQIPHPRLIELVVPPTQVDPETLARVRAAEPDPMAGLARPHVLLLVGGPTAHHALGEADAGRMARDVAAAAAAIGGGLSIVTSRRTPAAVIAAIARSAPQAQLHEWRADAAKNPYLAYLANADLLVVTGESESMLAEAVAAGRPLTIYPLHPRPATRKNRLAARASAWAREAGPLGGLARRLLDDGWLTPRRELEIMHRRMEESGWARIFAGSLNVEPPAPHDEGAALTRRIAGLLGDEP
jgi:mitochondrial fission protein ELM1